MSSQKGNGMFAIKLKTISFEGKEVEVVQHSEVDNFGVLPQAFAWQKEGKFYIFVGIGFLSAPKKVQDWIICHELGHIKLGHTRYWIVNFLFGRIRNLVTFKPVIDRELAADAIANEITGSGNGGILLFNFLKRLGVDNAENKQRLAACVAYNERKVA